MILDATDWAVSEFGDTPGLDTRLPHRLVRTATALAARPSGSLPQRFAWAERKAADRLVDRAAARPDDLQAVHRDRTRERMAAAGGPVLILHDPTVLTYTDHAAVADRLGPITDSDARGFIRHDTLAVHPDGHELLGLIRQRTFGRHLAPPGETRARRYRRADRESETWLTAVTAACGGVGRRNRTRRRRRWPARTSCGCWRRCRRPARRIRTVRLFVDAVAKLGGWLGRKCDGPPGRESTWRGYQRLADVVLGVERAETMPRRRRPKPARCG